MVKINIYQNTKDNFYNQIINKFLDTKTGKYTKKINKKRKKNNTTKILWEVSLVQINKFIKSRLKDFDPNITLQKLILADYQYISRLVKHINKNKNRVKLTNIQKDIFLTLYSRLNNADFIRNLNVKVCPYCNRNYILNFLKLDKQNATAQLDHFFDKKKYPYLAVSLYNLVPSCGTCNQRKSTTQEDIFYPYTESFNDSMKFKVKGIKKRDELINQDKDFFDASRIELEFYTGNAEDEAKAKMHMKVFNIENLYNEHKDVVSELLLKRVVYSDDYIQSLLDDYQGKLFNNKEDLLRLITSGYIDDKEINKRPLSKLIKDISKDLDFY